jgi:hypothetical protein
MAELDVKGALHFSSSLFTWLATTWAEEKDDVQQALADHFAKVYKVSQPRVA